METTIGELHLTKTPNTVYTITMPEKYAQVLYDIFGQIGGSPSVSRRGLINDLREGLDDLGLVRDKLSPFASDLSGTLTFLDDPSV